MANLKPFNRNVGEFAVERARLRAKQRLKTTGPLVQSLTVFEVTDRGVTYGSNLPYAAIQHHGGTVRPTTVKLLAIPLDPKVKRGGLWPRDIDPTRELLSLVPVFGGRSGNTRFLLIDEEGLFGAAGKPLFALVTHVVIPGTRYAELTQQDIRVITQDLWRTHLART